jgi:hypothetical protein
LGIALIVCGVSLICLALIPKFRSDPVFPMTAPFQPFIAAQPSVDPDADAELYKRDQPQIRPSEQRG